MCNLKESICMSVLKYRNTNIIFHRRNILDCDVVFLVTFSLAKSFWRELLIDAETELLN